MNKRNQQHLALRPQRPPRRVVALGVGVALALVLLLGQSSSRAEGLLGPVIGQEQGQLQPPQAVHDPAQEAASAPAAAAEEGIAIPTQLPDLTSRQNLGPALQMMLLLTVVSLAPAILVLCTSFTRIIIVLSLLRQALGTQNLPPNQVLTGLALFMTCVVMAPTWNDISSKAVQPYLNGEITQQEAVEKGLFSVREFMAAQITAADNEDTVLMFEQYARQPPSKTWNDVSTTTLIPAFVLSELKVAFLMGFKVYLPFLVIDLIISAVLISMGMMMLPPIMISLPFKLLLFVLVDGWTLVVGSLMGSFVLAGG
jgi:flagellar biosynthetic protein FliP